ncbi:unnamed protein product [Parnassius apollo]|uniref:(apollo) hypothetical protein n=1 Tax=Parnassius apollo TaxID=110799 RepID=A0A8S3XUG4_PARAO|nr:unnamed protein product [Parnassius apollo]
MSSSLNFIKAIVEELCERKSNLLIAEIALQFMMEKLAMNPDVISGQLKEALNRRILQRRNATLASHAEIIALIVKINETYFCKDKAATTVFEAEDGLPLREIQRQQRLEDEREQETAKTFKEQLKTKVNESLHNTAEELKDANMKCSSYEQQIECLKAKRQVLEISEENESYDISTECQNRRLISTIPECTEPAISSNINNKGYNARATALSKPPRTNYAAAAARKAVDTKVGDNDGNDWIEVKNKNKRRSNLIQRGGRKEQKEEMG